MKYLVIAAAFVLAAVVSGVPGVVGVAIGIALAGHAID